MRVRFTPQALAELDQVLSYVAARSPQGAQRVGDRVRAALDAMAEQPGIGARTTNPRLRRLVLRPYPSLTISTGRKRKPASSDPVPGLGRYLGSRSHLKTRFAFTV